MNLRLRKLFELSPDGDVVPLITPDVAEPGQLTQSLCSPWQNDYRECACYYWAASRPATMTCTVPETCSSPSGLT